MKMKKQRVYELRYGTPHNYKAILIDDFEQALSLYDKVKRFAENHNLTWIIALWDGGWLVKSETVNGEVVTYEELLNR